MEENRASAPSAQLPSQYQHKFSDLEALQTTSCWIFCKKGTFHVKVGSIKDRNGMDLTEAEDIKKRWQEYWKQIWGLMGFWGLKKTMQADPSGLNQQPAWSWGEPRRCQALYPDPREADHL